MNALSSGTAGCGGSGCQCASTAQAVGESAEPVASINGIALHEAGQRPDAATLTERAYAELLRQRAVVAGLLPRHSTRLAPELGEPERKVIEAMLDQAVASPQPDEGECSRYYAANKTRFLVGQALHVRHILFAVTPGVNVQALAVHAEKALLELSRKGVDPERFAQLADELSNCPSSTQGGDLGWISPDDCAPELASELFHQKYSQSSMGVHPRLFHTRFGFHIIDVLERRGGRQPSFREVRQRIAAELAMQSRARALHQFMSLLVGQAQLQGIDLDGADSPLVQ